MAAVIGNDQLPYVQVAQIHDPNRHVRAVSTLFPVKHIQSAVSFVESATEAELSRALAKMEGLLADAEQVQHLLTKFNRPDQQKQKPNYNQYIQHKRYKS